MKMSEVLNLLVALRELDGYTKIVMEGGRETSVQASYVFTAATRFTLAKNIAKLQPLAKAYQDAFNAKVKEISGGESKVPKEKEAQFLEELRPLQEQEEEVELTKITEADMKLEVNPIPGSVLANLLPIIQ